MSLFIIDIISTCDSCFFFFRKERANGMHLYLHSARCSVALRSFLDCNPNYWCFIPLSWHDAVSEDLNHFRLRKTLSSSSSNKTSTTTTTTTAVAAATTSNLEQNNLVAMGTVDNRRVAHYLEHVPLPPAAYVFSYQKRKQQRLFFEQFLSMPVQHQSYSVVDLYQMKVIAVCKLTQLLNTFLP